MSMSMLMLMLSVVVVPLAAAALLQHIPQGSSVGPARSPELIGDPKLARSALSGQILFQTHSDDGLSPPTPTPPHPHPYPAHPSFSVSAAGCEGTPPPPSCPSEFPVPSGSVGAEGGKKRRERGMELTVTGTEGREERRKSEGR